MKTLEVVTIARLLSLELRHLLSDGKSQEAFEIAEMLTLLPADENDEVKSNAILGLLASFFAKNDERRKKRHLQPLLNILLDSGSLRAA